MRVAERLRGLVAERACQFALPGDMAPGLDLVGRNPLVFVIEGVAADGFGQGVGIEANQGMLGAPTNLVITAHDPDALANEQFVAAVEPGETQAVVARRTDLRGDR